MLIQRLTFAHPAVRRDTTDMFEMRQVSSPLHLDLRTRAVIYYLNYYLRAPADVQRLPGSVSDSIEEWVSGKTIPIIDSAVSSMALVVFSRTQQHSVAAAEAYVQYGELLRHAHQTLSSLVETNIDAALLVVFLMSRYEDSLHGRADNVPNSYLHHDGAAAILKIWRNQHPLEKLSATSAVKYSRRGIIRSALLRYLSVPAWLEDGQPFGECGRDLDYDRIMVQVARLRNQLTILQRNNFQLNSSSPKLFQELQKLRSEAANLDHALRHWATRIPSSWYPRRHLMPAASYLPTRDFFSSEVYSYSSIAYATLWLNYSATRLLVNQAWLKILELIQPYSDSSVYAHEVKECHSRLIATSVDMSSSIPFVLERFKVTDRGQQQTEITLNTDAEITPYVASLTAWPLGIGSCIGSLPVEHRQWFRNQLSFMGRILGCGILECVSAADLLDL
ncbi:hypothetical protein AYO20_06148 [Fonsecaea nubica]|uniref:Transcription factor domain-containing protein n=1 Tax=Fonsecaea nubica TaxID=856822 RepID=A0A178CXD1_9EURO|nr:hypothetical protein AYO20_06148 [Fonsecaea nubica]OAL34518.1 hypothetical protein AYO20_06148 [Fonsecaea nubica]